MNTKIKNKVSDKTDNMSELKAEVTEIDSVLGISATRENFAELKEELGQERAEIN